MMVLISAHNFITLYLGLELLSLSMYALVAMQRDSKLATEAAMKYFILGALASGMLLYGMSIIYGATGSLALNSIASAIQTGGLDITGHESAGQARPKWNLHAHRWAKSGRVIIHEWDEGMYEPFTWLRSYWQFIKKHNPSKEE